MLNKNQIVENNEKKKEHVKRNKKQDPLIQTLRDLIESQNWKLYLPDSNWKSLANTKRHSPRNINEKQDIVEDVNTANQFVQI